MVVMSRKSKAINESRKQITSTSLIENHRSSDKCFTRKRSLSFSILMALIIRKSVKSLQNVVNEAMSWLDLPPVTASAYSQARYKLKHSAFIELNRTAIVEKLTALFLTNPTVDRKHRNPPRKKSSARRLLNFHKRQKKHCF